LEGAIGPIRGYAVPERGKQMNDGRRMRSLGLISVSGDYVKDHLNSSKTTIQKGFWSLLVQLDDGKLSIQMGVMHIFDVKIA
jgi:hypothetical protein